MKFFKGTAAEVAASSKTGAGGDLVIEEDTGNIRITDGSTLLGALKRLVRSDEVPILSGGKVPVSNLPTATTAAIGGLELATNTEVETATDNARAVTPAGLLHSISNGAVADGLSASIARPLQSITQHVPTSEDDEPGAVLVFSPDDGYTQQVADIAVINARGYPASLNLTRGWVDLAGTNATWADTYITGAQVQAIVDHAVGNEITYHDNSDHKSQVNQLANLGAAGLGAYVQDFRSWVLTTFGYDVKTGAYPAGMSDNRTREIMGRAGLEFMRGTKGVPGNYADDPFDTPGVDILTLPLATITAAIDTAITRRSLISLLWHGGGDATFRTKLGQVIDYCEAHGVPIKTYYEAMDERTAWRGQSAAMVDRQGNAFFNTVRTRRQEFGRRDTVNSNVWVDFDTVSNALYMDGDNGQPFDYRSQGLRVTGTKFAVGRRANYSGTTTNGSASVQIPFLSTDNSIIGKTITGPGITAGTLVGSIIDATHLGMVAADGVTAAPAGVGAGLGTIVIGWPTAPVADFYGTTQFHGTTRLLGSSAGTGYSLNTLDGTQTIIYKANGITRSATGAYTVDLGGGNLENRAPRVRQQDSSGNNVLSHALAAPTDASIDNGETVTYPDPATGTLLFKGKTSGGTVFGPFTLARVTPRLSSTVDTATLTIDAGSYDAAKVTALAQAMTVAAPTGTPAAMQTLVIRIKDNGTARGLTWNSAFRAVGVTLPTSTTISKTLYVGAKWNADDSKWDVIAVAQES